MLEDFQEIYYSVSRNKFRTVLTGFSIAWGIFMLIVLLGVGNGLINAFKAMSGNLPLNSVRIYPGFASMEYNGLNPGRGTRLNTADIQMSERSFASNVSSAGAQLTLSSVILTGPKGYVSLNINGVYPDYTRFQPMAMVYGRFINLPDMEGKRKSIVLHSKTADVLYGKAADAVGQTLRCGSMVYEVVGVYSDDNSIGSPNAYIPFSTLQLIYQKGDRVDNITISTKGLDSEKANNDFEASYRKAMGRKHSFHSDDLSAIWINNRFLNNIQMQKAQNMLVTALWVVGILTLLSGIAGISNIMFITVKERTRELGIRRALGAKPFSIIKQIILESIVITSIFGYVGMVAGIVFTEWMNVSIGGKSVNVGVFSAKIFVDPTVDINVAFQAMMVLVIAGTLAGLLPARKAVSISPIEALRTE